jgi:hypothetical protein
MKSVLLRATLSEQRRHAFEAFVNTMQGLSVAAIRKGFLDIGVLVIGVEADARRAGRGIADQLKPFFASEGWSSYSEPEGDGRC